MIDSSVSKGSTPLVGVNSTMVGRVRKVYGVSFYIMRAILERLGFMNRGKALRIGLYALHVDLYSYGSL